jgi:hypothetical protein|tara:strand:- start:1356 stop:1499 length:144 start_codon:yes stop_codon:yes gene_type:complete
MYQQVIIRPDENRWSLFCLSRAGQAERLAFFKKYNFCYQICKAIAIA